MQRLNGKVTLVTGGGSGIGRATCLAFAGEGAHVVAADVDVAAAADVVQEIRRAGGQAESIPLDVSIESAWDAAMNAILAQRQRLDVLVNNAGISFAGPIANMTLADWRRVLAVNLDGVFLGTRSAIRAMAGKGGSIVNVSSVSGITPFASASAYGVSKAGIRHFSKIAAIECADGGTGVRVNVVSPAGVKTPMWESMAFFKDLITQRGGADEAFAAMAGGVPSLEFFAPEEIARTILYLASDESAHLNGVELVLSRGHT